MRSLCVFCGSRMGNPPVYEQAAQVTGELIARRGWKLIYGGGSVGLMGVLANGVLSEGGEVVGVIPEFLATREVLHTGLSELKIVESMHERKRLMAESSDAFVALPGGYGTFEELFEVITWSQLKLHNKPIGILNTAGYFTQLLEFLDRGIADGFIREQEREHLIVDDDPGRLLERLEAEASSADSSRLRANKI